MLDTYIYRLANFIFVQKNLPRKMRRKLEARREMLENEREDDDNQVSINILNSLIIFTVIIYVCRVFPSHIHTNMHLVVFCKLQ